MTMLPEQIIWTEEVNRATGDRLALLNDHSPFNSVCISISCMPGSNRVEDMHWWPCPNFPDQEALTHRVERLWQQQVTQHAAWTEPTTSTEDPS